MLHCQRQRRNGGASSHTLHSTLYRIETHCKIMTSSLHSLHGFDVFPLDRTAQMSLSDTLYSRLTDCGVSHHHANLATDPTHAAEFRAMLQEELKMITAFHQQITGSRVACTFNPKKGCIEVEKGRGYFGPQPTSEWIDALKQSAQTGRADRSPTSTMAATTARRTADTTHSPCVFSTPPEFHGFGTGSSPPDVSPQVVVVDDD